ncbi:MAG: M18 family aminopeptidase [Planctomycetota bacterium]|nr:M18 family aminopeptidase [Planctomycetota bacterium]
MTRPDTTTARELCSYIDASPSPFHACAEAARMLADAGFERLEEVEAWEHRPGGFFVVRGGSLVAWALVGDCEPWRGFRIVGAHTDSPNLRIKPQPDTRSAGCCQLGVEVYGGALLNSWLDRDLGLSGRVFLRGDGGPRERLFAIDRALLRVPQLAIHLHPEIKTDGLLLNKQRHMVPMWGLDSDGRGENGDERGFRDLLGRELDVEPDDVVSWDAMCHDVNPSRLLGFDEELISAPRIDNLASCYAALKALIAAFGRGDATHHIPVVCLFDHEEVGSGSARGAESPLLRTLLERTVLARGGSREDFHRALADSVCVSADGAHATHPNYVDRHEPDHQLRMNAGPVIKVNTNQRYASEGETEALFQQACEQADVPFQKFVNRSDLACGSTIGPLTAANLGVRTVDVGCAQLAMHSARETCGAHDPGYLVRALDAFLD